MNDRSLGQINAPSPAKNVTPPPVKVSPSISAKGSRNRSSGSMNPSGPKRNFSSGLHLANMSAKQSPAAAEGSGPLGWLSSWFPSAGLTPVQVTKTLIPNPSKGTLQWLDILVYLFSLWQHTHRLSMHLWRPAKPITTSLRNLGLNIDLWNGANLLLPRACICLT
jgi:hypothetical protein